jgi:hypothetical protein
VFQNPDGELGPLLCQGVLIAEIFQGAIQQGFFLFPLRCAFLAVYKQGENLFHRPEFAAKINHLWQMILTS